MVVGWEQCLSYVYFMKPVHSILPHLLPSPSWTVTSGDLTVMSENSTPV